MNSNYSRPVNLGNPDEYRIVDLAEIVRDLVGNGNPILKCDQVEDDPRRRRPDISVARQQLDNWSPTTPLVDGLKKTIGYFRAELDKIKNGHNKNKKNEGKYSDSDEENEEANRSSFENLFYLFDQDMASKRDEL